MYFRDEIDWFNEETAKIAMQADKREAEHVIRIADETLHNTFIFDREWDLEQTSEPVVFQGDIDFNYNPGNDPEFLWQFNRHQFLICLAEAYLMTGEEKYIAKMIAIMEHFMKTQADVENKRQTTWRILEIGIRSANWIKALYIASSCKLLQKDFLSQVYSFLQLHGQIIVEEHNPYCYAGNWGILENHGLFMIGTLLNIEDFRKQAVEVLDKALAMQVMPDGMQLEQSTMYHNEIIRCLLDVIYYAGACHIKLPVRLKKNVFNMLYIGLNFRKPNGHQVSMGDSDDMNVGMVYQAAAVVFEDSVFRWAAPKEMYFDNVFMLGKRGVKRFRELTIETPMLGSMELNHSGHYFMRSDWSDDMNMLHFDGGLLGTSHGHNDALHVDLVVEGKDVLVDSGRYTYVYGTDRMEFRGTGAHNTIMVDNEETNEWENSWFTKTTAAQTRQAMYTAKNYTFASAGHTGYMRLKNPVFVNRKVISISNEIFVIIDECYTSGRHCYNHNFHFSHEGILDVTKKKAIFDNDGKKTSIFFDARSKVEERLSKESLHYNQYVENVCVSEFFKTKGFHSCVTVFMDGADKRNKVKLVPVTSYVGNVVLADNVATGIELAYKNKKYRIIVCHTEMTAPVTLYGIGENMGCGNVIIFDLDDESMEGTVLNW